VFPARLALATKNPGKVGEILAICSGWPVEWVTFRQASWPDIVETGESYIENARLKAKAVAGAVGLPALAEDSGIEVDALGGGPGIRSARFAGAGATDRQNLELLIARISLVPPEGRTARYRCVAVCVWPVGDEASGEGTCEGRLIPEPRGAGGFGYDPIFVPEGSDRTMAELPPEAKNAVSHRGTALRALGTFLERA
jgi:XTP/dITP diphosphohydrolase